MLWQDVRALVVNIGQGQRQWTVIMHSEQEAIIADGNTGQGTVDNESSVTVDSNSRLTVDSDKDIYNIGEGRGGNEQGI